MPTRCTTRVTTNGLTPMTTPSDPCATCNRVHGVDGYNPQHPFRAKGSSGGLSAPQTDEKRDDVRVTTPAFPFDPVLRQALIDKGVLTPEDLQYAETKIRIVSGMFQDAVANGAKPYVHMTEVNDDDGTAPSLGRS